MSEAKAKEKIEYLETMLKEAVKENEELKEMLKRIGYHHIIGSYEAMA